VEQEVLRRQPRAGNDRSGILLMLVVESSNEASFGALQRKFTGGQVREVEASIFAGNRGDHVRRVANIAEYDSCLRQRRKSQGVYGKTGDMEGRSRLRYERGREQKGYEKRRGCNDRMRVCVREGVNAVPNGCTLKTRYRASEVPHSGT